MWSKFMDLMKSAKTWAWVFAALAADGHVLGDNTTSVIIAIGKALGITAVGP